MTISPLGFMYASSGGFLSIGSLVGKSNYKFPPDAAAISGLILGANQIQNFMNPSLLQQELVVAGPFWAYTRSPKDFYVPMPRHRIIGATGENKWASVDEWSLARQSNQSNSQYLNQYRWHRGSGDIKGSASTIWQRINTWNWTNEEIKENDQSLRSSPWKSTPFLHTQMRNDERHVLHEDGLFLENAVQLPEDVCLVYLTNLETIDLNGWYRLGGEGHLAEIETKPINERHPLNRLLAQKISHAFALITPAVWGSNNLSYRYPQHPSFPKRDLKLLMDKPVPYRYRVGQNKDDPRKGRRLGRGRYAVPSGSVYVFREPLNMTWWDFPEEWFPKEGFSLKQLGCGLCLPVEIQGVPECTTERSA
ncbi:MAG: type III-B CRISPR module-associated Cmr3 family protein [Limnothrix sp. BL-A-16]